MLYPSSLVAVVLLLAPAAHAQRTWVVDALGGVGHDFTDLPPALAAARHGDSILMRPGAYRGASTDRAVTILGDNARLTSVLTVSRVPPGRAFVLAGVAAEEAIVCTDNPGRIHFERVTAMGANRGPQLIIPSVEIASCAAFTATGCRFIDGPTRVSRSSVAFTGCELAGAQPVTLIKYGWSGSPGLIAADSVVVVARCRVRGGDGAPLWIGYIAPTVAVELTACQTKLMGGPGDSCRAGTAVNGVGAGVVVISGGSTTIDPTLPLQPSGNRPPISGGPVTSSRMPALLAAGAPPGGRIDTELYAPAGQVAALLLGLPRAPGTTAFGALWLDAPVVTDVGAVGATERRAVALSVPGDASLRGLAVAFHSASADLGVGSVELSNPAVVVLD